MENLEQRIGKIKERIQKQEEVLVRTRGEVLTELLSKGVGMFERREGDLMDRFSAIQKDLEDLGRLSKLTEILLSGKADEIMLSSKNIITFPDSEDVQGEETLLPRPYQSDLDGGERESSERREE